MRVERGIESYIPEEILDSIDNFFDAYYDKPEPDELHNNAAHILRQLLEAFELR